MRLISCVVTGLFLCLASMSVSAETMSYSFNFNFTNFAGTSESSFGVPQFDPNLGTLTSITETLTGNITLTGDGTYHFSTENGISQTSSMSGPFSLQTTLTGFAAAGYIGTPGFLSYRLDVLDYSTTGTASFSSIGPVVNTYTYNYTPNVAATPEPSSMALLGTGLVGVFASVRRQKRTL